MPAKTEKQRKFMGAELQRKREGKKTQTGMSEKRAREDGQQGRREEELAAQQQASEQGRQGRPGCGRPAGSACCWPPPHSVRARSQGSWISAAR